MTTDFGSPAVQTTRSGEDRHVDLGTNPAPGRGVLRPWLNTTAWWTEPRPAISTLLVDAREGEWTVKGWHRVCRVCWLHTTARAGRVLPWLAARWAVEPRPRLWGELPTVRGVADGVEVGHWLRGGYVVANWCSWIADGATRSGVAVAVVWLGANWANQVPVLRWLVPDPVTAAYWWPGLVTIAPTAGRVLGAIATLAAAVSAFVWHRRRAWRLQREAASRRAELLAPHRDPRALRHPGRHGGGSYNVDDVFDDWQDDQSAAEEN